jgi:methylated-DNA-[protein]-cysteine S-methyltransferase
MKTYRKLKTKVLGELLLIADGAELVGVYFSDGKHALRPQSDWKFDAEHPVLRQASQEITEYLKGERTDFSVPMHCVGTKFQREVWRQIARIPIGETISYTELARRAGAVNAVRAAGTATGSNPICVIIPCHRVVRKGGTLGGYAGGSDRKKELLRMESKIKS